MRSVIEKKKKSRYPKCKSCQKKKKRKRKEKENGRKMYEIALRSTKRKRE